MIYFYFSFLHLEDKYKKTVFFKEKTQFWFGLNYKKGSWLKFGKSELIPLKSLLPY